MAEKRDWDALTEAEQNTVLNRAAIGNILIAAFWIALIVTLHRYFNEGDWVQSLIAGIVAIAIGAAINPDEKLVENIYGRSWLRSAGIVILLGILGAGVGSLLKEKTGVHEEPAILAAVPVSVPLPQDVVDDAATKLIEARNLVAEEERKETERLAKVQQQEAEQRAAAQKANEPLDVDAAITKAVDLLVLSNNEPSNNASSTKRLWQQYCDGTDHSSAYSKYRIPAGKRVPSAEYCLGMMYEYGIGAQKNVRNAIEWILSAATHGYSQAQNDIGYKFRYGIILPKDFEKAFHWTQLAAEKEFAKSQVNLGTMYESGEGIPENLQFAYYWYLKAAKQGNSIGQFNMGIMYERGRGTTRNIERAVHWYEKAAEQGHVKAQYFLAESYSGGKGIETDYRVVLYWHTKAAEQGYAKSQNRLGWIYRRVVDPNVELDSNLALSWHQKAAEQGDANGQYNLGRMYVHEWGMKTDHTKARYWYTKALEQGHPKAERALSEVDEIEVKWATNKLAIERMEREDYLINNPEPSVDCSKISNELAQLRCYTEDENAVFADDDSASSNSDWYSDYNASSGSTETWNAPSYGGTTSYEADPACDLPVFQGYEIGAGNGKHGVAIPKGGDQPYGDNDCRPTSNKGPAVTGAQ